MDTKDKISRKLSDLISLYVLIFGALLVILGIQLTIYLAIMSSISVVWIGVLLLILGAFIVSIMLKDQIYSRLIFRPAYPPPAAPPHAPIIPTARPMPGEPAPNIRNVSSPPYPSYRPPYYAPPPSPGVPYFSVPYITYIQYFRETLSIPHIRTLLYIFLISIFGGSMVLVAGFPWVMTFPIFFIIAFTFPSFIWISYVYHKDILEPESKHAIFLTLTWGMFSTIFAIFPNTIADILYGGMVAAVLVAPFNEEFFKPLGIRRVAKEIDSELDGLIYGVTCGMGFAIVENFSYELSFLFIGESSIVAWSVGAFIRGLGSTIIHAVGAGLIGFTYARIKLEKKGNMNPHEPVSWRKNPLTNLSLIGAYLVAVFIHMCWNFSASISELWDALPAIPLSILGHLLTFSMAFYIIKFLANEGIERDMIRHKGASYVHPIETRQ